jgi:putative acetyltransferase
MIVREEAESDFAAIRRVNEAAFEGAVEADLVEALRAEGAVLQSLVAEIDRRVVGHTLFSRMWVDAPSGPVAAVALAPVAVLPEWQRQGIGGRLIRHGLDALRGAGERIVIVLGHPEYYPRFGFSSERALRLDSPFPPEAYMALELEPGSLDGVHGPVRYARAFGL